MGQQSQFEWVQSRFWRWWLRSYVQRTWFRVSIQVATAVLLILAAFSTPVAWNALSLDPILANPSLILVLTVVELLFSIGTGLSAVQIAVESCVGALIGGGLELGVSYAVYGINGGTHTGPTKAVLTIVFGSVLLFVFGASRFKYRQYNILFLILSMTLGVGLAGAYHMPNRIWRFALYWWAFVLIASAATALVATFVLPVTAGAVVRKKLAKAVRLEGAVLAAVVDLMTSELDEKTGLLKAASGQASLATGIDSGLEQHVMAVHAKSMGANTSLQVAMTHMRAATLEVDVYRPTRLFPARPFDSLLALARTLLTPAMMLFYPVQTGRLRLTLCRRHAAELRALAAAFVRCADSVADVLRHNRPIEAATAATEAMEAAYVALMRAALDAHWADAAGSGAGGAAPLPNDRLALNMALSLLYTCCTRLRRMYALLPEALARDQPGALAHVALHFRKARDWDFASMAQSSLQHGSSTRRLVRQSLVGPQSSTKELVGRLLAEQPPLHVQVSMTKDRPARRRAGWASRALRWVEARTGYTRAQLSLGTQLAVAYAGVTVFLVVEPIYNAVQQRSTWAVFIVLAIHEPLAGSAVWKSILRIGGTVVAGVLGLGALYFTYLCNGLSYENHPAKFIVMTLSLAVLSVPLAAGAVKYGVRNAYFFIISCIVMYTVALPGYTHDEPLPKLALWRLVCTAMGIAVEVIVTHLVFPVTARMSFTAATAGTLAALAEVVDAAFHSVLPRQPSRRSMRRGGGRGGGRSGAAALPGASPLATAGTAAGGEAPGGTGPSSSGRQGLPTVQLAVFAGAPTGADGSTHGGSVHSGTLALPPIAEQPEQEAAAPVLHQQEQQLDGWQGSGAVPEDPSKAGYEGAGEAAQAAPSAPWSASAAEAEEGGSSPVALPFLPPEQGAAAADLSAHCSDSFAAWQRAQQQAGSAPSSPRGPLQQSVRRRSLGPHWQHSHAASRAGSLDLGSPRSAGRPLKRSSQDPQAAQLELDRFSTTSVASGATGTSGLSGVSVYARLDEDLQHMIFGRVIVQLRPTATKVASQIAGMVAMLGPLRYEVNPLSTPPRFPIKAGLRVGRLCRRALNIITAFAISMDSQHTTRVPLLAPHAAQLERLLGQLKEAFLAMSAMVTGKGEIAWAVRAVSNLEAHLEQLLLRVAVQGEGAPVSEGEALQGLAFLSMLFNTSWAARLLCIAVVQAFFSASAEAQEEVAELVRDSARWALDEKLTLLAGEILGASVGGAPAPAEPRGEEAA